MRRTFDHRASTVRAGRVAGSVTQRVGLDVVDIDRVRRLLRRRGDRFLKRTLTAEERTYCKGRRDAVPHIAGTLGAKEAVFKALGMAPRWQEVEIRRLRGGRPVVALSGSLRRRAQALGLAEFQVSITHAEGVAAAVTVGVGA
jgi:holo-[acyl-carrier protein] synthase